MPANRQSESCFSVIVGCAALRTVRRRAISSMRSLPSRASGRLAPCRHRRCAYRAPAADRFGRFAQLQRLRLGQRDVIGILDAKMHHRGRNAPFPGRRGIPPRSRQAPSPAPPSPTSRPAGRRPPAFLCRHVGHQPDDVVERLPVAELAEEGDQVDAALEHALGQEIAGRAAGRRRGNRQASALIVNFIRRHRSLLKRKDRRPKPAVVVWGCFAIKPC